MHCGEFQKKEIDHHSLSQFLLTEFLCENAAHFSLIQSFLIYTFILTNKQTNNISSSSPSSCMTMWVLWVVCMNIHCARILNQLIHYLSYLISFSDPYRTFIFINFIAGVTTILPIQEKNKIKEEISVRLHKCTNGNSWIDFNRIASESAKMCRSNGNNC